MWWYITAKPLYRYTVAVCGPGWFHVCWDKIAALPRLRSSVYLLSVDVIKWIQSTTHWRKERQAGRDRGLLQEADALHFLFLLYTLLSILISSYIFPSFSSSLHPQARLWVLFRIPFPATPSQLTMKCQKIRYSCPPLKAPPPPSLVGWHS